MDLATSLDQAKQFFGKLYGGLDEKSIVEFRLIAKSLQPITIFRRVSEIDDTTLKMLKKRNGDGYNVYCGVNVRTRMRGTSDCIGAPRAIVVDFDGVPSSVAREIIRQEGLPPPTMVISSGHGCHAWWILEEPISHDRWTRTQSAMAMKLGGDPKIKDLPRIIRVPGFLNTKSDPAVLCEIVDINDGEWSISEFPETLPEFAPNTPSGSAGELLTATTLFLQYGANEGSRNQRAFAAACDMLASGVKAEEARRKIRESGQRCGLSAEECDVVFKSASSRIREKRSDDYAMNKEIEEWCNSLLVFEDGVPPPVAASAIVGRVSVINYALDEVISPDGETLKVRRPIEIAEIAKPIRAAGLVKAVSGLLFSEDSCGKIRYLDSIDRLFGYLHRVANLDWYGGAAKNPRRDGKKQAFITKGELFGAMPGLVDSYDSIESMPHSPMIRSSYYTTEAKIAECGTSRLEEFLDMLTPATVVDRATIKAMFLTGLWGGPPGARPLFLIASKDGRGAGKSTLAECFSVLFGRTIQISDKDNAETISRKIVSESGVESRGIVFDNIKSQLGGQYIESSITAATLEGHRLYHGRMVRGNYLTWIATANTFSLTHDMTQRAVSIMLLKPDYTKEDPRDFAARHREEILGGLVSIMSRPPAPAPKGWRWPKWASEVLGRCIDPAQAIEHYRGHWAEADDDSDLALQLAEALDEAICAKMGPVLIRSDCFNLPLKFVRDVMVKAELCRSGDTVQQAMRKLNEVADIEPLKTRMTRLKGRGDRGRRIRWRGDSCTNESNPIDIQHDSE